MRSRGYVYLRGEYPIGSAAIGRPRSPSSGRRDTSEGDVAGSELRIRCGPPDRVRRCLHLRGGDGPLQLDRRAIGGEPRQKPPFPTQAGLFGNGRPLVNNVESLMNVPDIVRGGRSSRSLQIGTDGVDRAQSCSASRATSMIPACTRPRSVQRPGELTSIGARWRASTASCTAVLVGGAAGIVPAIQGSARRPPHVRGHSVQAGIVTRLRRGRPRLQHRDADMEAIVQRIAHFFSEESCGLCVPCRVGTVRQEEALVPHARRMEPPITTVSFASLAQTRRHGPARTHRSAGSGSSRATPSRRRSTSG